MSTAEILSLISLISYIVAGVSLVLALFFWFFFKIPSVIGDLSGRTARKSIARKRASNERSAGKGYQPSVTNVNRGKLTETMGHSRKLKNSQRKDLAGNSEQMPETGLLDANRADVVDSPQTELLDNEATGVLVDDEATVALDQDIPKPVRRSGGKKLNMIDEVILIHTDEVIR